MLSIKSHYEKVENTLLKNLIVMVNLASVFVLFSLLENDGSTLSEIGLRAQIENSSLDYYGG